MRSARQTLPFCILSSRLGNQQKSRTASAVTLTKSHSAARLSILNPDIRENLKWKPVSLMQDQREPRPVAFRPHLAMGLALWERYPGAPNRTHGVPLGAGLAHFQGFFHGVPPGWRLKVEEITHNL